MKERGIIVPALSVRVHIFSGSFGSAVDKFLWRAEFIYLAARLARQWMEERGIIVCTLIVGFIYVTSHAKTFLTVFVRTAERTASERIRNGLTSRLKRIG